MAEQGQRPVPEAEEEGVWVVRGGQAIEAGPGNPFPGPQSPGSGLTVGNLFRTPQGAPGEGTVAAPAAGGQVTAGLDYSNPFRQEIERVWFDGKIVYAVELGELDIDPALLKVAQEYQIVYHVELDERGKPKAEPERVPGQYNIYDSVPGMEKYSPLWQFNYVVVPRDYVPNTLRSEADCLQSGNPILKSTKIEN